MKNQCTSKFPFAQSDWNAEIDHSRPSTSSLELQQAHLTKSPSVQIFSTPIPQKLTNDVFTSQDNENKATKGCLGCSTWPRTLAFISVLVLCGLIAIGLPIILVNTLVVPVKITITTTTSTTATTVTTTTTTTDTTTTTTTTQTTTTTTTSFCGVACGRTTPSSSARIAHYTFDSTTNDQTGTYPATSLNIPTYVTGYVDNAISLNALSFDGLTTSSMNFFNQSFTIELWFYLTQVPTQDNAFFGEQSASNVGQHCLFLMTRMGYLYMGFYDDDTTGGTMLQAGIWYHAAFVYDNSQRQRLIYLNGVLQASSGTGVGPYLGTTGSVTIGFANIDGNIGAAYFSGYIDQLMVSERAKSACEILDDATLAAYLPFDYSYSDAGPNSLPISSSGTSFVNGYINRAVSLSGSNSYIQIAGLTSLGQSNNPYSIAFWIYPIVTGVLVHVSGSSTGLNWCTPFLTFTTSSQIITQVYNAGSTITLTSPIISTYTWTHIIQTFSPINGQKLYINGALYTSSSSSNNYSSSGMIDFLTFGNMLQGSAQCYVPNTGLNTTFQGYLDELRVYSRELSSIDACLLAQS